MTTRKKRTRTAGRPKRIAPRAMKRAVTRSKTRQVVVSQTLMSDRDYPARLMDSAPGKL